MSDLRPILTFEYALGARSVTLEHAPDGWDEQMVKWVRNKKYYGMFRSFTIPLKFVKDGAFHLRKDFYTWGLDAAATLTVKRRDHATYQYYTVFTGEFDFSTFKDTQNYVEVNLVDSGLVKLVKDNEAVEYEVPNSRFGSIYQDVQIFWELDHVTNFDHNFYGIHLIDFVKRIIDLMTDGKITDGTYEVASTLLDSLKSRLVIAPGYEIRYNSTIVQAGLYPLKTTFKDFFKSLDAVTPIGVGIEVRSGVETLVIEDRNYSYDQTELIDLGDVSDFSISVYKDYNFASVKTGYPEKDYDDEAYSINEFNVEVELLAPNPSTSDDYEVRSKFRADGRGIQQIIDNSDGAAWDNDSSDEDIFFVEVYNLSAGTGTSGADVVDMAAGVMRKKDTPAVGHSAWNCWLSPKRCLLRHKSFINSCMFKIEDLPLTYTSGGKDQANNETQATQVSAEWVEEYSGFTLNPTEVTDQYLKPFEIKFDAPYPEYMTSVIGNHPNRMIKFSYNGYEFYGYILEIEMQLSGRGSQSIKLLSTFNNELTNLIRST